MLRPTLPFDPQETLTSYADRLSMFHTGRGMERLLRDNGVKHEHFVSGRVDAVLGFAEAIGHSADDIRRNAIRVYQRGGEFRGEAISKSFLLPQAKRYCPACLIEDGGPTDWKFRLLWGFRHVQRCGQHGILLATTDKPKATCLRVAMNEMNLAEPSHTASEQPSYLNWLEARLAGACDTDPAWLADQTLEQILNAAEMIGAVLEHGHEVKLSQLTPPETEEATDIGFSIYREGPDAVVEALDAIRQASPARAVQAGPLAYYGALYEWLHRRSNAIDPGPIRDLLRDHIVKHSAVEPHSAVLGEEITERRFHSLKSLSREVGIDRSRLSRLLRKLGKIPNDATEVEGASMVFEAATTVPLIEAFQTGIPLRDVPDYLGATKRQIEILYREGFVQPLVPRAERGSVRQVVFGRSHLDGILKQVAELPEQVTSDDEDLHPISYACQRGAGRFEHLFIEILEGRIPAFRDPSKKGVGAILVEVRPLLAAKIAA